MGVVVWCALELLLDSLNYILLGATDSSVTPNPTWTKMPKSLPVANGASWSGCQAQVSAVVSAVFELGTAFVFGATMTERGPCAVIGTAFGTSLLLTSFADSSLCVRAL